MTKNVLGIDGLEQDYSNSIATALVELLQSCHGYNILVMGK